MKVEKSLAQAVITAYQKQYRVLAPDDDSVQLTKAVWSHWEKAGVTPPDIDAIAQEHSRFENGFFYDIVSVAERLAGKELPIQYCAFCLDSYNFYAFSADDGYIILVDDSFFQLLFFLSNILIFQAQGLIQPAEEEAIRQLTTEVITNNYFNRRQFDFTQDSLFSSLLKRDYELTEFANYFFHALKVFIISHEIGHHILGHTIAKVKRVFGSNDTFEAIYVDERSIACEYEADKYGYQLFHEVSTTVDASISYAYCQYKFEFAPLFLFDLFAYLDNLKTVSLSKAVTYKTHPAPQKRIASLQKAFPIDNEDPLYLSLKESMATILPKSI